MASAWRVKKVKFNLSEPYVTSKKLEKEQLVSVRSEEQTRIKVPYKAGGERRKLHIWMQRKIPSWEVVMPHAGL